MAGVDVAQMGVKSPEHASDEFVQFSETGRGVYQTVVIRDGTLIGATLVGDVSKVGALIQAFDSRSALPEERVTLLFDLGSASDSSAAADLPDDTQVCNCNGVSKNDLVKCVEDGAESVAACMAETRAGKGCGSCKGLVREVVEAALGGAGVEDPSESHYVPGIPLDKPTLMTEIRSRGLKSVSAVCAALALSGCPRNCAESMVKDVGLVAVEGGRWQIYVGGAAGATIRKGDVLATVDTHEEAVGSPGGSCSTTARTRTGSNGPTTSCHVWAWTTSPA